MVRGPLGLDWLGDGVKCPAHPNGLIRKVRAVEAQEMGAATIIYNQVPPEIKIMEGTTWEEWVTVLGTCTLQYSIDEKECREKFTVISNGYQNFDMILGTRPPTPWCTRTIQNYLDFIQKAGGFFESLAFSSGLEASQRGCTGW